MSASALNESSSMILTESEGELLERLRRGGEPELARCFERLRGELHRMLRYRIDRQLKRRLDGSDIIQDAFLESCRRLEGYLQNPIIPPVAWVRRLVRQALFRMQRDHLETQQRCIRREQEGNDLVASVDICEISASMTPPDARAQNGTHAQSSFRCYRACHCLKAKS